jgi:hypothetical protein
MPTTHGDKTARLQLALDIQTKSKFCAMEAG